MMRITGLAMLCVALAACGAQTPADSGAASSPAAGTSDTCHVDAARFCESVRNAPISLTGSGGGLSMSSRELQDSTTPTMWVHWPITAPGGTQVAEVQCYVNTRKRAVIYAKVLTEPSTAAGAKFLRDQGMCKD